MRRIIIFISLLLLMSGTAYAQSECDVWLGTWDVTYNDGSTYVWELDEIITGRSANIKCQAFGKSTPTDGGEPFFIQIIYVVFSDDFIYSESEEAGQEMGKHVVVLNDASDAFESGTGFTDYDIAFGTKRGVSGPRCSMVSPNYVFQGAQDVEVVIEGTETNFDSALSSVSFACPEVEVVDFAVVSSEEIILTINVPEDAEPSDCNVTVTTGSEDITCKFTVRESIPTERLEWEFESEGIIQSSPAVADGLVYFGSTDHKVYCLDAKTGEKVWEYETASGVSSSPLVADGRLYIGSNDNKIYCLDAIAGEILWEYETADVVASSAAIYNTKIYIGNYDEKVYCLDAITGEKIWEYETIADVYSTPAVADGKVFVGDVRHTMYCLDAELGTLLWTFETEGDIPPSPAVSDGYVYFGSKDHNFYCVDAETGEKVWSYKTGNIVYSSPAVAGKYVYFGSLDHKLYSLDKKTGELNYVFYTGSVIHGSPAVTGQNVYIGSGDTFLYCIDAGNGKKNWTSRTGGAIASSPAVADGKVFFGSFDKKFYCLKAEDNDQGSWPMFRYNIQRTGELEGVCLAMMVFGDNSPEVIKLRRFRDDVLKNSSSGQKLIDLYYSCEGSIAEYYTKNTGAAFAIDNTFKGMMPFVNSLLKICN